MNKNKQNDVQTTTLPIPGDKDHQNQQKTPTQSRKLIQKQLILLLHSHVCLKKDLVEPIRPNCNVPNCSMMRDVWVHILQCQTGSNCPEVHCVSSLKILAHWKSCKNVDCCVCQLVRIKWAQQLELQQQKQQESQIMMRNVGVGDDNYEIQASGQSTSLKNQGQMCEGQSHRQPGSESLLNSSSSSYYINYPDNDNCCNAIQCSSSNYQNHSIFPTSSSSSSGLNWMHSSTDTMNEEIIQPPYFSSQQNTFQNFNNFCPCGNSECCENDPQSSSFCMDSSFSSAQQDEDTENNSILSVPSANDVRRAYEQLGIPCPVDALQRLMATLPGGNNEDAILDSCKNNEFVDKDDGIGIYDTKINE